MLRKKRRIMIIIFLIVFYVMGNTILQNIMLVKGTKLENVVYKSNNLIISMLQEGEGENLIVLGSGYSLSVDENNKVISHDPMMLVQNAKVFNENATVMSFYFPFECSGLEVAGRELSDFLNDNVGNYENVTVVGHSKCGVCIANAARWMDNSIKIVAVSVPYQGTKVVDKEWINSNLNPIESLLYQFLFSNHIVDQDIMENSLFLQNSDFSGISNHEFVNIISVCPSNPKNLLEKFLKWWDQKCEIQGDGIVARESQILQEKNIIQMEVETVHATSLPLAIIIARQYIPYL